MNTLNIPDLLQAGSYLVTAVWAILSIKASNEKLGVRIEHLGEKVEKLADSQDTTRSELAKLTERVIRLESYITK